MTGSHGGVTERPTDPLQAQRAEAAATQSQPLQYLVPAQSLGQSARPVVSYACFLVVEDGESWVVAS